MFMPDRVPVIPFGVLSCNLSRTYASTFHRLRMTDRLIQSGNFLTSALQGSRQAKPHLIYQTFLEHISALQAVYLS